MLPTDEIVKIHIFIEDWEIEKLRSITGKALQSEIELERAVEHYLLDCLDMA